MFEGEWYRAKILQRFSDIQYRVGVKRKFFFFDKINLSFACPHFHQVFYVDYGNCENVNINDMRQWDDAFDRYPFQALECSLDNITKLKDCDEKAIAYFEQLVFQKPTLATVT